MCMRAPPVRTCIICKYHAYLPRNGCFREKKAEFLAQPHALHKACLRWCFQYICYLVCVEAALILGTMPLKAFALPTLGVVALLLEVLPASECASGSFNKCTNENLQGHRQDELNKQEEEVEDCNPALLSDVTVRKREKIRCDQRQQLLVLARKQHVLERQMRKGLLSWSEVASWKLTHIEVQRLFLRIVQLKVRLSIYTN